RPPGPAGSLAIARVVVDGRGDVSPVGVAIYDNGLPRRWLAGNFVCCPTRIAFAASASRLYGLETTLGLVFDRITVDRTGAAVLDQTRDLITGLAPEIRFDAGLLVTSNGSVIDPEARRLLGTFAVHSMGTLVAPDATVGKVL